MDFSTYLNGLVEKCGWHINEKYRDRTIGLYFSMDRENRETTVITPENGKSFTIFKNGGAEKCPEWEEVIIEIIGETNPGNYVVEIRSSGILVPENDNYHMKELLKRNSANKLVSWQIQTDQLDENIEIESFTLARCSLTQNLDSIELLQTIQFLILEKSYVRRKYDSLIDFHTRELAPGYLNNPRIKWSN